MARTLPFHGKDRGSNPLRATNLKIFSIMKIKFLSKLITAMLYVVASVGAIIISYRIFYDIGSQGVINFIGMLPVILFICFLHFVSFRLFIDYLRYDK